MRGTGAHLLRSFIAVALTGAVGIAAAGPSKSKKVDSAMPADVDSVQVTVTAGKGRLGVEVLQISPELRSLYGAAADRGVLVNAVRPDSPAAKAGLRVGDIVTDVDGAPARSATDMLDAMSDRKRGDAISIALIRDKKRVTLRATLDEDPGPQVFGSGQLDGLDPQFREWFQRFPQGRGFAPNELERQLEDAVRRIEALEDRLGKLERT